jgi:hypothetical protein
MTFIKYSKVIKDYAYELANTFNLYDKERVHKIAKATAIYKNKRNIPHTVEKYYIENKSGQIPFS